MRLISWTLQSGSEHLQPGERKIVGLGVKID
jgi:hypothetical protein